MTDIKPRIIRYKPAGKRRKALDRANHPLLALTALVGFVWLGHASLNHTPPRRLNCEDLGLCNLKTGEVYFKKRKPTMTVKQANIIMDVLNLTDADLTKPVILWKD